MKKIISTNTNSLKALAIILFVIYYLPVQTGVFVLDSIKGVLYCGVDVFENRYELGNALWLVVTIGAVVFSILYHKLIKGIVAGMQ